MMAALQNRRFLVFGGASILCFLFLLVGLMINARQAVALSAQRRDIDQQKKDLTTALQGVNLDQLREENDSLTRELGEIERSLPEAEYMPTLIRQIETAAAMTGNDIIELRPGEIRKGLSLSPQGQPEAGGQPNAGDQSKTNPPAGGAAPAGAANAAPAGGAAANQGAAAEAADKGQRYDEMDIELRFEGSYAGAFDFIKQLGKLGKIIAVNTVEIERSGPNAVRPDKLTAATVRLEVKAYILAPRTGFPGELTIKVF